MILANYSRRTRLESDKEQETELTCENVQVTAVETTTASQNRGMLILVVEHGELEGPEEVHEDGPSGDDRLIDCPLR